MKTYKVALARTYVVTIHADCPDSAKAFSEFYLGHCSDLSTPKDRLDKMFSIVDIETVENDAIDIEETEIADEIENLQPY